jgi:hypothetical protein
MQLNAVGSDTGLAMQKIKEAHAGDLHLRMGVEEVRGRGMVALGELCSRVLNPRGQGLFAPTQ